MPFFLGPNSRNMCALGSTAIFDDDGMVEARDGGHCTMLIIIKSTTEIWEEYFVIEIFTI